MEKILWTNTTDDKRFSYHAETALLLIFPGVFLLFFAVLGFLMVRYGGAVGGMLLLYLYACMVFGILLIHGVTGNRDYLVTMKIRALFRLLNFREVATSSHVASSEGTYSATMNTKKGCCRMSPRNSFGETL